MTTNTQQTHPLAWSQSGSPIELSSEAEVWRVRRLSGNSKGGAPEVVYGAQGTPLILALETTPEEFVEEVKGRPGKYRLDALDDSHTAVSGIPPAYHVVAESHGHPRAPAPPVAQSADVVATTNNALVEALKDSSARITQMVEATASIIQAADGAGIARRKPLPMLAAAEPVAAPQAEEGEQAPQSPWWQDLVAGVLPVVVQMAPTVMSYMAQARAAKAQAQQPAPAPPPSERATQQPKPEPESDPEPEVEPDFNLDLEAELPPEDEADKDAA